MPASTADVAQALARVRTGLRGVEPVLREAGTAAVNVDRALAQRVARLAISVRTAVEEVEHLQVAAARVGSSPWRST